MDFIKIKNEIMSTIAESKSSKVELIRKKDSTLIRIDSLD
ncbi:hypothetical protein BH09BAC2_BH09BAC2_14490 [soil metagenome]